MKLILFVAIIGGILAIFGIVYGISFLVEKNKKGKRPKTVTKAPDDDPQFLRDLARRLNEEEQNKGKAPNAEAGSESTNPDDESGQGQPKDKTDD
jgi:hypothetical protein